MRCKGLHGLLLLSCSLALGLGCGDDEGGGWEPVAGKDAKAHWLIVPGLHRDETHTVTFRIFNNGSQTIPAGFQARLEVFEDASHSVAYCAPITMTQPTDIVSGQTVDVEFLLPVDIATPVGTTLYLVATADSLDEIVEAIESNNVSERSGQVALERRADLVVESVALPRYMLQGSSYTVTVTVRNVDDKAATAPFFVEVAEPSASWSNTWQENTDLAPGEAVDLTTTYVVGGAAALGDRTFTATADTTAAVDERDEGNNSLADVSPVATMDLAIELRDWPAQYYVGVPFSVTFRVTNGGSISSQPTQVSNYIAPDVYDPWIISWPPSDVPSLAPGTYVDITRSLTIGFSVSGNVLMFYADYDDLIEEDDESNNYTGLLLTD